MAFYERYLGGCAALAVAALFTTSPTHAQDAAALNAEAAQKDWPTHHGVAPARTIPVRTRDPRRL